MKDVQRPVLVLGAGINGAAVARELLLNQVPVTIVDTADVASGTTSYSSRLIHGGLRYLEYGELDLVRQSLCERSELLRQAPHLVRPLRLFIPVSSRWSGAFQTARRLVHLEGRRPRPGKPRGLWSIRAGLWLYDRYARGSSLPHHAVHRSGTVAVPKVDGRTYDWLCSFYDAHAPFPELLTIALLEDAREIARESGVAFQVFTYHQATRIGREMRLQPVHADGPTDALHPPGPGPGRFQPAVIVNTTGAWVDETLTSLGVRGPRLIGGTRGSHLVVSNPALVEALGGNGVYVEAPDGRPVFFLPFGAATLVGTTDVPYHGDPRAAVATEEEVDYLLAVANRVFPHVKLEPDEIEMTYAGVRPLPVARARLTAAITRRHRVTIHTGTEIPIVTLVGGKLTTCRNSAEELAGKVLPILGRPVIAGSRGRILTGGQPVVSGPPTPCDAQREQTARQYHVALDQVNAIWSLWGTRTPSILSAFGERGGTTQGDNHRACVPGTAYPHAFVRWVIRNQWVRTLSDLVERRLMLLFQPGLSRRSLTNLATHLCAEGFCNESETEAEVRRCAHRLRTHYRKVLLD